MTTGVALDADLDVMVGTNENGFGTIAFTSGANIIAQRIIEKLSMSKFQIWYQWQFGLYYETLFKQTRFTFEQIRPQIISQIRKLILSTDGVQDIVGNIDFVVDYDTRGVRIIVPCVRVFCDSISQEVQIGAIDVN